MKYRSLALFAALASAGMAKADLTYRYIHAFDFSDNTNVTNIILFNETATGGGATWAFSAEGPGIVTVANPFPQTTPHLRNWAIGITNDGVNDHFVVTMNNGDALGQEFNSYFSGFDEATMIQAVKDYTSGLPLGNPTLEDGFAKVDAFNDAYKSQFYTNIGAVSSLVKFSGGTTIGSYTSQVQVVPEPASMALLGAGAVALARRRKRRLA